MSQTDDFEMLDSAPKGPYDWTPPHWVPYPVPSDYDIFAAPWIRPEQVPMSFVGASPTDASNPLPLPR